MQYEKNETYQLAKILSKLNVTQEIRELLIAWCEDDNASYIDNPCLGNFIMNEAQPILLSFLLPMACERRIAEQESELKKLKEVASEYKERDITQPLIIVPDEHLMVMAENLMKSYGTLDLRGRFIGNRALQNKRILAGFYSIFIKHKFIIMVGPLEKLNENAIVQFLNNRYGIKDLQEFRRHRCECEQLVLNKFPAVRNLIEEKLKNQYKQFKLKDHERI